MLFIYPWLSVFQSAPVAGPALSCQWGWTPEKDEKGERFLTLCFTLHYCQRAVQLEWEALKSRCRDVRGSIPEQRRWSVWTTCWGGPPPAAASQSQNVGGRCERKPWTDASGWFWPQTWSSSERELLWDRRWWKMLMLRRRYNVSASANSFSLHHDVKLMFKLNSWVFLHSVAILCSQPLTEV